MPYTEQNIRILNRIIAILNEEGCIHRVTTYILGAYHHKNL